MTSYFEVCSTFAHELPGLTKKVIPLSAHRVFPVLGPGEAQRSEGRTGLAPQSHLIMSSQVPSLVRTRGLNGPLQTNAIVRSKNRHVILQEALALVGWAVGSASGRSTCPFTVGRTPGPWECPMQGSQGTVNKRDPYMAVGLWVGGACCHTHRCVQVARPHTHAHTRSVKRNAFQLISGSMSTSPC